MSTATEFIQEQLRRCGARLRSNLEREFAFIKPVRQDVLTHEASDGGILEPTLVWATQEFRALDRLFGVHAELDRLRKRRRGQASHERGNLKRTEQHLRRVLLAFQKERQAMCEEVLKVARAQTDKEEADKCSRSLERCEEKLKSALADGIQGKLEVGESWIRVDTLENELRAVEQNLEQERTLRLSEAVHCDSAGKECAQAMGNLAFQKVTSTKLAGEAEQVFAQMSTYLNVIGTENRDLRSELGEAHACLQAQLVVVDRVTVEKEGMAEEFARVRDEAGTVAAELAHVRKETERYDAENIERMAREIKLLSLNSRELQSTLGEERRLIRELREQLDELAVQRNRIADDRQTLVGRLAQMQTRDSMAAAENLRLTAVLQEKEAACRNLTAVVNTMQADHTQTVRVWNDRKKTLEAAYDAAVTDIERVKAAGDHVREELDQARKLILLFTPQMKELHQAKRTVEILGARCEGYQRQVQAAVDASDRVRQAADVDLAQMSRQLDDVTQKVRVLETRSAVEQRGRVDAGSSRMPGWLVLGGGEQRQLEQQTELVRTRPGVPDSGRHSMCVGMVAQPGSISHAVGEQASDQHGVRVSQPRASSLAGFNVARAGRAPTVIDTFPEVAQVEGVDAHDVLDESDRYAFRPLLPVAI
ncbi:hypothetical protein LTR85_008018 [Meristemomyces frigidus]|nr:hypothetical protein LTR85_008018 [Meristemomyces frigidus]